MPEDTYLGISKVASSGSLRDREVACAVKESIPDYEQWVYEHRWEYAAQPGWAAAFESAEVSGNPDPGAAPDVITDGQILSATQAIRGS